MLANACVNFVPVSCLGFIDTRSILAIFRSLLEEAAFEADATDTLMLLGRRYVPVILPFLVAAVSYEADF